MFPTGITLALSRVRMTLLTQAERACLWTRLEEVEAHFNRACNEISVLDQKLNDVQVRYERANRDVNRSMRYHLRLRLATLEGIRNVFYEYCVKKADEINSLRASLGIIPMERADE